MPTGVICLKQLIDVELESLTDVRVTTQVRGMLVEPHIVQLDWDYGERGQQYPGWIVLKDARHGLEIVYCKHGFGPRCPWGLTGSSKDGRPMGMDCGWFTTFLGAFFNSCADELPIWRVFMIAPDGTRTALTEEGEWNATWSRVHDLRRGNPEKRYDCGHSIVYGPRC